MWTTMKKKTTRAERRPSMEAAGVAIATLALAGACRMPPATVEPAPAPRAERAATMVESPGRALERGPSAAQAPTIADYFSFIGLEIGDGRSEVEARFGPPTWVSPSDASTPFDTYYYVVTFDTSPGQPPDAGDEYLFDISITSPGDRVIAILARHAPGVDYRDHGIDDPRLEPLGVHVDDVYARFGEPISRHAGFNTYEYEDPGDGRVVSVEFVCFDHDDFICNEIWVSWLE